jgi:hypothetical protein
MLSRVEVRSAERGLRLTYRSLMLLLLAIHALLLSFSATRHSPIVDEVAHLPAGLSHWHLGTFSLFRANPPLVRLVGAFPILGVNPGTNWRRMNDAPGARPEFKVGFDFAEANAGRYLQLFPIARIACVPFSLLAGYICFCWAKDLHGGRSGVFACLLWCSCPLVLAFGPTIMPDIGSAATGVLAAYLFWKWLYFPSARYALWCGVALGLALLTKFTWLILIPLWPICWLFWRATSAPAQSQESRHQIPQMAMILCVALLILNSGYGFEGSFRPLGDYRFVSESLNNIDSNVTGNRFDGTFLAKLPVPLPLHFVLGLDAQKREFERGFQSYLRGNWKLKGWWYYYAYALMVKMPLGLILLFFVAVDVPRGDADAKERNSQLYLLVHALAVFFLISAQTGINHHLRLLLPMFPFVFIYMSRLLRAGASRWTKRLVLVCTTWSVLSSLWCYPHSLAYFNELVGGPLRGRAHLLGSNLDWGQDLLYLKVWLNEHPECQDLGLAYFGKFDPRLARIRYRLPPPGTASAGQNESQALSELGPQPGWYAVSVSFLQGDVAPLHDGKGSMTMAIPPVYRYFDSFEPVATAGYSIYVYHITPEQAHVLRKSQGYD